MSDNTEKASIYGLPPIKIFTDAAVRDDKYAISAFMIVDNKKTFNLVEEVVEQKAHIHVAEMTAVRLAITRLKDYLKKKHANTPYRDIEIYSDNLGNIKTLREAYACEGMLDLSHIKDSNLEAKIQANIVAHILTKFNVDVSFNHVKSHIRVKDLNNAKEFYERVNETQITLVDFLYLCEQNTKCDETVSRILEQNF